MKPAKKPAAASPDADGIKLQAATAFMRAVEKRGEALRHRGAIELNDVTAGNHVAVLRFGAGMRLGSHARGGGENERESDETLHGGHLGVWSGARHVQHPHHPDRV